MPETETITGHYDVELEVIGTAWVEFDDESADLARDAAEFIVTRGDIQNIEYRVVAVREYDGKGGLIERWTA
jgi:hypothetical protein